LATSPLVAAELASQVRIRLVLDALGDHAEAQVLREIDAREGDGAVTARSFLAFPTMRER
jgi:hypothetical protein